MSPPPSTTLLLLVLSWCYGAETTHGSSSWSATLDASAVSYIRYHDPTTHALRGILARSSIPIHPEHDGDIIQHLWIEYAKTDTKHISSYNKVETTPDSITLYSTTEARYVDFATEQIWEAFYHEDGEQWTDWEWCGEIWMKGEPERGVFEQLRRGLADAGWGWGWDPRVTEASNVAFVEYGNRHDGGEQVALHLFPDPEQEFLHPQLPTPVQCGPLVLPSILPSRPTAFPLPFHAPSTHFADMAFERGAPSTVRLLSHPPPAGFLTEYLNSVPATWLQVDYGSTNVTIWEELDRTPAEVRLLRVVHEDKPLVEIATIDIAHDRITYVTFSGSGIDPDPKKEGRMLYVEAGPPHDAEGFELVDGRYLTELHQGH